jgi:voltage-gated potassium channel
MFRTAIYLIFIVTLHVLFMDVVEGMPLADSLWLTVTTITTVGYGDLAANTPTGRLATFLLLYVGGIYVLAKMAGDYFEYRRKQSDLKQQGKWEWDMRDHLLIINTPRYHGDRYLVRLLEQLRKSTRYRRRPIQFLSTGFDGGLPESLASFDPVAFTRGRADEPGKLSEVDAADAHTIVVLAADEHDLVADSQTFDTLHRLFEMGVKATVLAECVEDRNQNRLRRLGPALITRPIRAYPGMIVRCLAAPGLEQLMDQMFRLGDVEFRRIDVTVRGLSWGVIVERLIRGDLGTPVAFVDARNGGIVSYPEPDCTPEVDGLILISRSRRVATPELVSEALGSEPTQPPALR